MKEKVKLTPDQEKFLNRYSIIKVSDGVDCLSIPFTFRRCSDGMYHVELNQNKKSGPDNALMDLSDIVIGSFINFLRDKGLLNDALYYLHYNDTSQLIEFLHRKSPDYFVSATLPFNIISSDLINSWDYMYNKVISRA